MSELTITTASCQPKGSPEVHGTAELIGNALAAWAVEGTATSLVLHIEHEGQLKIIEVELGPVLNLQPILGDKNRCSGSVRLKVTRQMAGIGTEVVRRPPELSLP